MTYNQEQNVMLVIDCKNILYKIFYRMLRQENPVFGEYATKITTTFLAHILNYAQTFHSNKIIFAWDSIGADFRKEVFPGYKADREVTTEKTYAQQIFEWIRNVAVPSIGFKNNIYLDGLEADDILAQMAEQFTYMIQFTNDKDLYSTLRKDISIYNPYTRKMFTIKDFTEKYGIDVTDWYKVKAYAGCNSDKIPGVNGIAEKRACQFINGQLKEGTKAYNNIASCDGSKIYDFNVPLVKLPHERTPELTLMPDEFSLRGLTGLCNTLESTALLSDMTVWNNLFNNTL